MAVNLSPVGGVAAQFFTNTGAVLTGGKLYTYAAGTTTPAATYTSSSGATPWTNPIVLDAAGRVPSSGEIWLTDGISYKFVLKDSNDVLIATYDNISGINSNFVSYTSDQEIITATSGQTIFPLTISYQPGTNSLSVFVDGVNQYGPGAQYAFVETDANTVTFTSGLHVGAEVKFTTTQQQGAGAIDASQVSYVPPFVDSVATNVEAKLAQTISVQDFGAVGDGVTDDTDAFTAAFAATLNSSLFVPDGDYLIDNSASPFIVTNFQGGLTFEDNARLVFTTNTVGGIWFNNGTGAKINNIQIGYQTPPTVRTSAQEGIRFTGMTDVWLNGAYVENSPAAGVLFNECVRPKTSDINIVSSKADGLHFANCKDPQVVNLTTVDTGDDGLAFVNYASGTANTGGTATNISIRNSKARGISVVGQSDVTISNFVVNGTSSSGIYTAYESAYSTRVPAKVTWSSGTVISAGTVSPTVGNQFGIEYSGVTSVRFSDIQVISSANRGMSGTTAVNGLIEASNIIVDSPAAGSGFNLSGGVVSVDNLFSKNTEDYGIYMSNCSNIYASNLKVNNAAKSAILHRAVWFDTNTRVLVDGIELIDDQATATGYVIGAGTSQTGVINNVSVSLVNGTYSFQNNSSPGLVSTVSYENEAKFGARWSGFFIGYGTAVPTTGTYKVGDRVYNSVPTVGQPKSWVCTVAGTPGTWVSEGNL